MTWLQGQLPANLGLPLPATIDRRPGLQIEVRPSTHLRQTCDFDFLLTEAGTAQDPRRIEIPIDGRHVRLAAIEVSDNVVIVMTAGPWTNQFGDSTADSDALIASMTFE